MIIDITGDFHYNVKTEVFFSMKRFLSNCIFFSRIESKIFYDDLSFDNSYVLHIEPDYDICNS